MTSLCGGSEFFLVYTKAMVMNKNYYNNFAKQAAPQGGYQELTSCWSREIVLDYATIVTFMLFSEQKTMCCCSEAQ